MARPFSIDLRERVVSAVVRGGVSCRGAGRRHGQSRLPQEQGHSGHRSQAVLPAKVFPRLESHLSVNALHSPVGQ